MFTIFHGTQRSEQNKLKWGKQYVFHSFVHSFIAQYFFLWGRSQGSTAGKTWIVHGFQQHMVLALDQCQDVTNAHTRCNHSPDSLLTVGPLSVGVGQSCTTYKVRRANLININVLRGANVYFILL